MFTMQVRNSASDLFILINETTVREIKDSDLFYKGIYHWALSSVQLPMCVVEPGTAADVGKIVGIVFSSFSS